MIEGLLRVDEMDTDEPACMNLVSILESRTIQAHFYVGKNIEFLEIYHSH